MSHSGSCACSAITFSIPDKQKEVNVCHCVTCRKWTGGIYVGISGGKNPTIQDSANSLTIWKSSDYAERAFCNKCGTSLYFKLTDEALSVAGNYFFGAGTLDNWDDDMTMTTELFIENKPQAYCFVKSGPNHNLLTKADYEANVLSKK